MKEIDLVDTKITDKWGVMWNEMETVRDFLQNFYDANDIKDINISIDNKTVKVLAPEIFDYQELLYLGSDKNENSEAIGQYGEGWKASVLNALRNFNCSVEIIINDKKLKFFFKDKKIGKTVKRVVFCQVLEVKAINGSMLVVGNCPPAIIQEFKFGLKYFYHENNPLFGEELSTTWDNRITFLKSTENSGYVFYKKLLRAQIDVPIIIICNKPYHYVEIKIKHDRDRKAFNDEVLERLLKYVCKNIPDREEVVRYMKDYWISGHKILNIIAEAVRWRNRISMEFPENYYAKDSNSNQRDKKDFDLYLERDRILEEFKRKKFIECPHYMSYFGMKTPLSEAEKVLEKKLEKNIQTYSRKVNFSEQTSINLLMEFIRNYSKKLFEKCQDFTFIIADTQKTIEDLKKKQKYDDKNIYIKKTFFTYNFVDAIVSLISEFDTHHKMRSDSDFSDFYIALISAFLKGKTTVNGLMNYKTKWDNLIGMIVEGENFIPIEIQQEKISTNQIDKLREFFIVNRAI